MSKSASRSAVSRVPRSSLWGPLLCKCHPTPDVTPKMSPPLPFSLARRLSPLDYTPFSIRGITHPGQGSFSSCTRTHKPKCYFKPERTAVLALGVMVWCCLLSRDHLLLKNPPRRLPTLHTAAPEWREGLRRQSVASAGEEEEKERCALDVFCPLEVLLSFRSCPAFASSKRDCDRQTLPNTCPALSQTLRASTHTRV